MAVKSAVGLTFALLLATGGAAADEGPARVVGADGPDGLVMRSEPNATARVILHIPAHRTVFQELCRGQDGATWCRVRFATDEDTLTGWVDGRFLARIQRKVVEYVPAPRAPTPRSRDREGDRRWEDLKRWADQRHAEREEEKRDNSPDILKLRCSIEQRCLAITQVGCGLDRPWSELRIRVDLQHGKWTEIWSNSSRSEVSEGDIVSMSEYKIVLKKKGDDDENISRRTGDYHGINAKHELGTTVTTGSCEKTTEKFGGGANRF